MLSMTECFPIIFTIFYIPMVYPFYSIAQDIQEVWFDAQIARPATSTFTRDEFHIRCNKYFPD